MDDVDVSYEVKREIFMEDVEYLIKCKFGSNKFHVRASVEGVSFPSFSPCPPALGRFLAEVLLVASRIAEDLAAHS